MKDVAARVVTLDRFVLLAPLGQWLETDGAFVTLLWSVVFVKAAPEFACGSWLAVLETVRQGGW